MLWLLRIWILLCAVITTAGWLLSAFRFLNRTGYAVVVLGGLAFLSVFALSRTRFRLTIPKWRRRLARPAPLLYGILASAAIAGGFLYPPVNVDGFSYRIPRALHWIGEQGWHWIHATDVRLNVVATGFDWLTVPLLLAFKSERAIPLINGISFLLLPGVIFVALSQLGVRKRVAWWWMWIIPAGYCYCMQAGSIANDMYAAVFSLAAVGFGMRARKSGDVWDVWISLLALALATGAKQTNLPFALPWLLAVAPTFGLARSHVAATLAVVALGIGASILPISTLNVWHGFPWQGFAAGRDFAPPNAFWGILGNGFWILFSNLQPPIIPWAGKWNELRLAFLASDAGAPFRSFEVFGYLYRAAAEQFSGIGSTVLLLAFITWLAGRIRNRAYARNADDAKWVRRAIWFGLLVFMAKVGINQCPRYLAPYYPLLFSSLLLWSDVNLIRCRWWRRLACGVMAISIALIFLSRQRPLFPAETLLQLARERTGSRGLMEKALNSYTFTSSLRRPFQALLQLIPEDQKLIGYAARFGDKEPWFWKPYFARKVLRVLNSDPPEAVRQSGLEYVVVDPSAIYPEHDKAIIQEMPSAHSGLKSIEEWLAAYNAELIGSTEIRTRPDDPPAKIYLARLRKYLAAPE